MSIRVVLATSNQGKAREAREILDGTKIEIVTLPMWLGDVETGTTYLENARLKAAAPMRMLNAPVLAEDAGLDVDALGGLPGVRSARFGGDQPKAGSGKAKLLALLRDVPDAERSARFRAVAVLLFPSGREIIGEGTVEGRVATQARGTGGFGYDPVFLPSDPSASGRTAAELEPEEKNRISHRGQALRSIAAQLD